ncbi:MAG: hypothetical protein PHS50_07905 [Kiritimatiellae bacterium]|nr:hypothetical protein [Kiritimatiellia bacterium]
MVAIREVDSRPATCDLRPALPPKNLVAWASRIVNNCREPARETDYLNEAKGAAHVDHAAQRIGYVGFAKIHRIADAAQRVGDDPQRGEIGINAQIDAEPCNTQLSVAFFIVA